MEKVKYIYEPVYDDVNKYGKYAKEIIRVVYKQNKEERKETLYLSDPKAYKVIKNYYNNLTKEKNNINKKQLGKRIKYNSIMAALGIAIMFTGLGVGNILTSLGINPTLVYVLVSFGVATSEGISFYHVNKDKFYYTNKEKKRISEIKRELSRCDSLEQKINKLDKKEMINIDFRRDQIDNRDLRIRNFERNKFLKINSKNNVLEAQKRIDNEVRKKMQNNKELKYSGNRLLLNENLSFTNEKFKLTKKILGRKIGRWFENKFIQGENYVIRGERRWKR